MDKERNCFTFFASFYDAMRVLPPPDKLRLYDAIVEYGLFGVLPDLQGVPRALFELMRPNINSSNKRRESGRLGGLAGGAPAGNQNARKFPLQENKAKTNQNQTDIEIDIDTDIEKNIDREKEKDGAEKIEEKGVQGERGEEKPPNFSPAVLQFPGGRLSPEDFEKKRQLEIYKMNNYKKDGAL